MKVWTMLRSELIEGMLIREKALAQARVRYRSEIRKYRGIDRLRRAYRAKQGRR